MREAEVVVSAKTAQRGVLAVGAELAERREVDPKRDDALAARPAEPPALAVVECDGGRLRTRAPGHGPGVHWAGEGWREDQNACLIRAARKTFAQDPQPEPPACFLEVQHVAKIAETEALSLAAPLPKNEVPEADMPMTAPAPAAEDGRPQRLVRPVLSSRADSQAFGRQMQREAKRRRFPEAAARAFLGDGPAWNCRSGNKAFGASARSSISFRC